MSDTSGQCQIHQVSVAYIRSVSDTSGHYQIRQVSVRYISSLSDTSDQCQIHQVIVRYVRSVSGTSVRYIMSGQCILYLPTNRQLHCVVKNQQIQYLTLYESYRIFVSGFFLFLFQTVSMKAKPKVS